MRVHLVRHAKAEKRVLWDGPDELRPLTALGLRQADGLAARLQATGIDRIVSSPHLRCQQSVEPLSRATGLPIELQACLAKGEQPSKAAEMIRGLGAATVVCCTHAEGIPDLAADLEEGGAEVLREARVAAEAGGETRRLAVLDMGSTSFHLLVADVARSGHLRTIDRERRMLRLGAEVASHGHIPDDVCVRAVSTAKALRRTAELLGAEEILPVATAALRDADNGEALARRLGKALGSPIRMLSGEEEARVIFQAFRRRVSLPADASTLGIDLGGGSLEFALGDRVDVDWERTLPLGVARLHRALVRQDPMRRKDARRVCEHVRESLLPLEPIVRKAAPRRVVLAGGTARALGDLARGFRGLRPVRSVNELELPLDELRGLAEVLVVSSHEERVRMPGIRRRRADLLPTGALILVTLAETFGVDGYTLTDWGLREGILLDAATEPARVQRSAGEEA